MRFRKMKKIATCLRRFKIIFLVIAFSGTCIYIKQMNSNKSLDNTEVEEIVPKVFHQVREYFVNNYTFTAKDKSLHETSKICLCTQSSIDHLYWLVHILETWDGPVSLSVYAPGSDWPIAVAILKYMRKCVPAVRNRVNVHFIYKSNFPPVEKEISVNNTCDNVIDGVKEWGKLRNKKYEKNYPQNLLRNTARLNCKSPYVTVLDIDLIPSVGMFGELEKFLNELEESPSEKNAYVIPVFEMDRNETFPRNKKELLQRAESKSAIPFYFGVSDIFHKPTDYEKWYSLNETDHVISAYQIPLDAGSKWDSLYEPYYLARSDNPLFDDTFEGFGTDRGLQVYELQLAGYNFHILDPVFVIHWSFHTFDQYKLSRAFEHLSNIVKQDQRRKKLKQKYNAK